MRVGETRRGARASLAILVLVALVSLSAPARGAERVKLFVKKAKLGFGERKGAPRHSLKISGSFAAEDLPEPFHPHSGSLEVRVGGETALAFEPGDGTAWTQKRGRWSGKAKGTSGCPGAARIRLTAGSGAFELAAKQVDLGDARAGGPEGVPVTLLVNGVEFAATVDFTEKGRCYRWKAPITVSTKGQPGGGGGGTGGGGGGGGGGTSPEVLRTVASGTRPRSGSTPWPTTLVIRSQSEWSYRWGKAFPGSAVPGVDFGTEQVVAVWHTGVGFNSFLAQSDGAEGYLVTWSPQLAFNCPQTGCPPTEAWMVVVVRRTAGQVTFRQQ